MKYMISYSKRQGYLKNRKFYCDVSDKDVFTPVYKRGNQKPHVGQNETHESTS